jgi:hypothetical protein
VEVTQTVPTHLAGLRAQLLAARHAQLETLFATVMGNPEPLPEDRVAELTKQYEARLA